MKSLNRFILIIGIQLCISLSFIVSFQRTFEFQPRIIVLHMCLVSMLMGGTILYMGMLMRIARFREWRYSRHILASIPAVGITFLFMLYIIDFAVNKMGARNITYDVFFLYIFRLKDLNEILPVPAIWLYLFFAGMATVIIALSLRLSTVIFEGIGELFLTGRAVSLFRERSRAVKSIAIICIIAGSFILVIVKYFNAVNYMIWIGEPVTNFIVYWSPIDSNEHRRAVAENDRRIRAAYPTGRSFQKKNVVLIIADSMRADHMQIYEYQRSTTPFLASMVEQGKIQKVKLADATCPETACGVLSTLASRNFYSLSDYNFKLHELLHDQGYKVYFIHSGDQTYYQRVRWYFGNSLDLFVDGNDSRRYSTTDDRVIFEGLERVPDYSGSPAFFYFHLMSTHFLGVRHDVYDRYTPSKIKNADHKKFMKGQFDASVLINRYDNGMLEADDVIKQIFSDLDRKGYLKDSFIIIIGDHGEALGEHEHFGHDYFLYQEDIRIPMLIYDSEGKKVANLEFASQVDVAPTIIDRLGLSIPSSWEGKSLFDKKIKSYSFHQTRWPPYIYSVLLRENRNIYKYIRWPRKANAGQSREELYELTRDPAELRNLILSADSELIFRMSKELGAGFALSEH